MNKKVNTQKIAEGLLKSYLLTMGINIKNPNFIETPARIYRMYKEMLYGMTKEGQEEIEKILKKTFPSCCQDMVVFSPLKIVALCPHHFLPVRMTCHVAYIPDGKKVIGLSKIPRLVNILAKQPILQEDLTPLIADTLYKKTSNKGVYVIIEGCHSCMQDRGVKTSAYAVNSAIRGVFQKQATRDEALNLLKLSNGGK